MTRPVSLEDLSAFNAELLALVQSGVSLERGLADLANASPDRLGDLARRLAGRMAEGETLPAALRQEGNAIPPIYGALVEAGVRSGRLTAALEGAAELAQEVRQVRQQVGQALLSPLLLLLLSFLLTVLFGVDLLHRHQLHNTAPRPIRATHQNRCSQSPSHKSPATQGGGSMKRLS